MLPRHLLLLDHGGERVAGRGASPLPPRRELFGQRGEGSLLGPGHPRRLVRLLPDRLVLLLGRSAPGRYSGSEFSVMPPPPLSHPRAARLRQRPRQEEQRRPLALPRHSIPRPIYIDDKEAVDEDDDEGEDDDDDDDGDGTAAVDDDSVFWNLCTWLF